MTVSRAVRLVDVGDLRPGDDLGYGVVVVEVIERLGKSVRFDIVTSQQTRTVPAGTRVTVWE